MLIAVGVLANLVSIGCLLYVIFKMFEEEGFLHAFLGFCCCQLYAYIWGWLKLDDDVKIKVMGTWTVAIIISAVAGTAARQQAIQAFGAGYESGYEQAEDAQPSE